MAPPGVAAPLLNGRDVEQNRGPLREVVRLLERFQGVLKAALPDTRSPESKSAARQRVRVWREGRSGPSGKHPPEQEAGRGVALQPDGRGGSRRRPSSELNTAREAPEPAESLRTLAQTAGDPGSSRANGVGPIPRRDDINKILSQRFRDPSSSDRPCEFDYSGTQGAKALTGLGYDVARELESGDDHDRPGAGPPHLHRAPEQGHARSHHRARAPRRAPAHAGRLDRGSTRRSSCSGTGVLEARRASTPSA